MCAERRHSRSCRPQQLQGGFTLLELLVVLVILAVALMAGIPTYTKTVEGARAQEAIHDLRAIRAAEEVFRSRTGAYTTGTLEYVDQINPALQLKLDPRDRPYTYHVTGDGATFTATAIPLEPRPHADTITITCTVNPNWACVWGGDSTFRPHEEE